MQSRLRFDTDPQGVLRAAQAGEEWAFRELYREFNPRLVRYFYSRVPAEAQDLAAETWLAVARGMASQKGGVEGFRPWLFAIAHRQLVSHWRRLAGRPASQPSKSLDQLDEVSVGPLGADPQVTVGEYLEARELARAIAEVLSPEQAEVVLLRVLGGLSVEEVSKVLGKRPGAVRVLSHRALKKLAGEKILLQRVTR